MTTDGYAGFTDYISKNLIDKISGFSNGLPSNVALDFTISTDNKGRVMQLAPSIGPQASSTIVFSYS